MERAFVAPICSYSDINQNIRWTVQSVPLLSVEFLCPHKYCPCQLLLLLHIWSSVLYHCQVQALYLDWRQNCALVLDILRIIKAWHVSGSLIGFLFLIKFKTVNILIYHLTRRRQSLKTTTSAVQRLHHCSVPCLLTWQVFPFHCTQTMSSLMSNCGSEFSQIF